MNARCHICSGELRHVVEYSTLHRVTSDCKPWPAGGQLGACTVCHTAQAVIDEQWHNECRSIYTKYTIYHQSDGREQPVFDPASGQPSARSDRLLAHLTQSAGLSETGRLLDFGCGNGGFLTSFSRRFASWRISGSEYNDKYRTNVESIPGFDTLYTGDPALLPDGFDAISLIHVLEHISSPLELLRILRTKLKADGVLIIQLPYFVENPFVLPVADHATHFDIASISTLLRAAGFSLLEITSSWVPKELSVLAIAGPVGLEPVDPPVDPKPVVTWLHSVRDQAAEAAGRVGPFGIFGTSIAGNWLFAELADQVDFFVDEDIDRTDREMNGRPIIPAAKVPADANVFIALPGPLAERVATRLSGGPGRYFKPTAITWL